MVSKFSERLRDLRLEKELSQRQLSKETSLSQNAISKWEKEQRLPNINAVIALAEFFGVTTDYILGVTND